MSGYSVFYWVILVLYLLLNLYLLNLSCTGMFCGLGEVVALIYGCAILIPYSLIIWSVKLYRNHKREKTAWWLAGIIFISVLIPVYLILSNSQF